MSTAEMTCRQCKAAMALHPIDPVCGQDGPLKVTLMRMPAMVCPNTHRRFAMPRFPVMLLDRVYQEHIETLPEGKKSGLLFKKYQCGDCGADLEKGTGRDETFDFDVTLESLPGFRVELTAPLYKCTACGKEQLRGRDDIRQSLPAAMALAFKAANLKPE